MTSRTKQFRELTDDKVYEYLDSGTPRDDHALAVEEIERRHLHRVGDAVKSLADSSSKMEALTVKLKQFTIWLMAFAIIQIAIASVQTWKMFQPEKPVQAVLPHPPPTAPQTPIPPPR